MTNRVDTFEISPFEASLMGIHCLHISIYGILYINGLNFMKQNNTEELHYLVLTVTKPYVGVQCKWASSRDLSACMHVKSFLNRHARLSSRARCMT